jgi:hypothetical protein
MTAVAAAALALVSAACGHTDHPAAHPSAAAAFCTTSALTSRTAAKQQPPAWKIAWHACAGDWAIAAGNSSVGLAVAVLHLTPAGWHAVGIDDGSYLFDAPGHPCGNVPPEPGYPAYGVRISLVRQAGLVIEGCGVGPPQSAVNASPAASPTPSLSPLQVWWDGMRPHIAAIGEAGKNLNCSSTTSGNELETAATAAVSYVENSRVPSAYDNITLVLDRALTLYQGAGGFCAAGEPSFANSYFSQGNAYLSQAVAAVRADGGQP